MIRFSSSAMHEGNVVIIFKGRQETASGPYLFEESKFLFSEENLAPNLVEISLSQQAPFDLGADPKFKKFIEDLEIRQPTKFLNFVEVSVEDLSNADLMIKYEKNSLNDDDLELLQLQLCKSFEFNVRFESDQSFKSPYVTSQLSKRSCRVHIVVSNNFLKSSGSRLSQRLHKFFDPNRYVDTQIPFFIVGTVLSASLKTT